jgi:integrase/recombinase XerD
VLARHKQFIKERQYVNNVSPATIRWYEQSLCWLDTESPTSDDIKALIVRLRERGLEPVSIKSRLQAVRACSHVLWTPRASSSLPTRTVNPCAAWST